MNPASTRMRIDRVARNGFTARLYDVSEWTPMIRDAIFPDDLASVRGLFREYADSLDVDLCFQGFEAELAGLPGSYARPGGRLLLAVDERGAPSGCVALRPVTTGVGEMKRLYVRPLARGTGLGAVLARRIIDEAREAGYTRICLDTLPSMHEARHLYERLGFRATEPYVHNPVPGALFLSLDLTAA